MNTLIELPVKLLRIISRKRCNNMRKIPKTILNHPSVYDVGSGEDADKKYDVLLKDDWFFSAIEPNPTRYTIRKHAFFDTVQQFLDAKPKQIKSLGEKKVLELLG